MPNCVDTVETRWFRIITLIIAAIIAIYSLANVVEYNKIRTASTGTTTISQGEATTMLWVSVVIFILSLVLFIWAIVRLFLSAREREELVERVKAVVSSEEGILPTRESPVLAAVPRTQPATVGTAVLGGQALPSGFATTRPGLRFATTRPDYYSV